MGKHYSDFEKHQTGKPSQTSDFVKHDCPAAKVERWIDGKKQTVGIAQKREFNSIKGNENMIAINCRAADVCGYCNLSTDDASMVPCTEQDVEALNK